MNLSQIIKARIELPCSIRFQEKGLGSTRGITEELSRESLVVIAYSTVIGEWLGKFAHIAVGIDLPHAREFRARVLECAATVSEISPAGDGVRIGGRISRMTIKDREPDHAAPDANNVFYSGIRPFTAIEGSRKFHRAVYPNRLTISKTQGEYTMSFLKNLLVEEDGQDMVEYGLVLGLVVLAAAAAVSGLGGKISAGFSTLGTSVAGDL